MRCRYDATERRKKGRPKPQRAQTGVAGNLCTLLFADAYSYRLLVIPRPGFDAPIRKHHQLYERNRMNLDARKEQEKKRIKKRTHASRAYTVS